MYLTETSLSPSLPSFRVFPKRSKRHDFDSVARSFDEKVFSRLHGLSPPSISLSWLSSAVDFLSFTHSESKHLISGLDPPPSVDSFDVYLNYSVKLLDICNSVASEIEKLRQRRLSVKFALHLVESSGVDSGVLSVEKIRRARDALSGWEGDSCGTATRSLFQISDPGNLFRDLVSELKIPSPGKVTSIEKLIQRTIYAVGLVTVLVSGAVLSAVYGLPNITAIRAPASFLWADSFNTLERETFKELKRLTSSGIGKASAKFAEIDDVTIQVRRLREDIDGVVTVDKGNETVGKGLLGAAVEEMETATSAFSQGLDRLSNGVNEMFRAVLSTRNGLLDRFRVAPKKCAK